MTCVRSASAQWGHWPNSIQSGTCHFAKSMADSEPTGTARPHWHTGSLAVGQLGGEVSFSNSAPTHYHSIEALPDRPCGSIFFYQVGIFSFYPSCSLYWLASGWDFPGRGLSVPRVRSFFILWFLGLQRKTPICTLFSAAMVWYGKQWQGDRISSILTAIPASASNEAKGMGHNLFLPWEQPFYPC